MRTRLALLLLGMCVACQPTDRTPEPRNPSPAALAVEEQPPIAVVLLVGGMTSLQGEVFEDSAFSEPYADLIREHAKPAGESRSRRPTVTTKVVASQDATWARLSPVLSVHMERSRGRFFIDNTEVLFPVCPSCATVEHPGKYDPIRIDTELDATALRKIVQPTVGGTALMHCQPTCSVKMVERVLRTLADAQVPYLFAIDPPSDGSLIRIESGIAEDPQEEEPD